jgi:hypothetical protein
MIKASLALMLSHGQHRRKQLGHHIAIIEFAQRHLPGASAGTFALFDRTRRKRNDPFYDIILVPGGGLEPPRPDKGLRILSPLCLPISPSGPLAPQPTHLLHANAFPRNIFH